MVQRLTVGEGCEVNKAIVGVLALALVMGAPALHAAPPASPDECVVQFFEASKNGDLDTMKQLIAGPFYAQRKTLFDENVQYPDFLRKHYADTRLQIMNMRAERGGWVADVRIKFPDGTVDSNKLLLQKDGTGSWKIIQDIYP
jgi:hypothetical protein